MKLDSSLEIAANDCIRLLESLSRHYGTEKGLAVWTQIKDILEPELRHTVFMLMLNNNTEAGDWRRVSIPAVTIPWEDRVAVVKVLREASECGLKEGIDYCNALMNGTNVELRVRRSQLRELSYFFLDRYDVKILSY